MKKDNALRWKHDLSGTNCIACGWTFVVMVVLVFSLQSNLLGATKKKTTGAPVQEVEPKLLVSDTHNTNLLLLNEAITPTLWEVKNPTKYTMSITRVALSCGCTSYEWFGGTTLGPGERAWLVTYTEKAKFSGNRLQAKITATVAVPTKNGIVSEIYTSEFFVNVVGTADVARSSSIVRNQQTITLGADSTARQLDFLNALRKQPNYITSSRAGNKLTVAVDTEVKDFGHTLIEVISPAGKTYIPIYSLP